MFWYCFMLCLVQISGQINNNKVKTYSADSLPQEDAIGNVALVIDNILNGLTRNLPLHGNDSCFPHTMTIGGIYRFVLSYRPFGHCPYCCSIGNIANHIGLYFTSKKKHGRFTRLKAVEIPDSFKTAGFNKDLLTIVYIHGFIEDVQGGISGNRILDAYLNRPEEYNIILVDWKNLSAGPWYKQAVDNTKIVGDALAGILKFYNKTGELYLSRVHLIGLSLGAHVAGFVGKRFKRRHKIGRITGLDPAFPLFPLNDISQRLSKFDADFVDVIHTNGGILGFPISVGHADFYPNGGGMYQPECNLSNLVENRLAHTAVFCSHYLAFEFYVQSVRNPKVFPAKKCESVSEGYFKNCSSVVDGYMGFSANKSSLGNFYLTTSEEWFLRSFREEIARRKKNN